MNTPSTEMVPIRGNTFPVKDKLKELGAKWDKDEKVWMVPLSREREARSLVEAAPVEQATPGKCAKCGKECKPQFRTCWNCKPAPTRCTQCNQEASRYVKIYKSGICSNCYRDDREEAEMGY